MIIVGNCAIRQAMCLCREFNFGAILATPKCVPHGKTYEERVAMCATCWWQSSADAAQLCTKRANKTIKVVYSTQPSQPLLIKTRFFFAWVSSFEKEMPLSSVGKTFDIKAERRKKTLLYKVSYLSFCLREHCVHFCPTTSNKIIKASTNGS